MPRGLNRTDLNKTGTSYRNGFPITLPHTFGNAITLPHEFGNPMTDGDDPTQFGNPVTWTPDPDYFGNIIGGGSQAAPVLSPNGGNLDAGTEVTMTAAGSTDIYYTVDGTTPTFPVTGTTIDYNDVEGPIIDDITNYTIKAIAVGPNGTSSVTSKNFTLNPPFISSVTPNNGPDTGGTSVVIIGTGFDLNGSNNYNTIIQLAAADLENNSVVSTTEWDVTSGPASDGTGDVTIINPDGQSYTFVNGWTYTP